MDLFRMIGSIAVRKRQRCRSLLLLITAGFISSLLLPGTGFGQASTTLTIAPASPQFASCHPLGIGGPSGSTWTPYLVWIYKNVPAFELKRDDILAFDTHALNDQDVQFDIELAPTTVNSGDVPALPFTKVVTNTQTPTNPRGNTVTNDFEMQFRAEAPFSFPGGGLVIRFSNPSATYSTDTTCSFVMPYTDSSDPSGFFVKRAYRDADGVPPWNVSDISGIGGFRVITFLPTQTNPAACRGEPATIVGTDGADKLTGSPAADVIAALGGNDKVSGLAGNDTICGGSGKDTLKGGKGSDKLYGESGKDILKGGPGKDKLKGGPGKDKQIQ